MENFYKTILTGNYIDALAMVANYLNDFDKEDREFEFADLDEAVWEYAENKNIDTDQALRVSTAIEMMLF